MRRRQKMLFILMFSMMVMLSGCSRHDSEVIQAISSADKTAENVQEDRSEEQTEEKKQTEVAQSSEKVYVYICGAVQSPGVYEVAADSRVFQLIELAGGMTEEADTTYLNQASFVIDGDKIYLPTKAEVEAGNVPANPENSLGASEDGVSRDTALEDTGKVNINTATAEELMTVNGIGPSRAESIISYREQNGAFSSIEDIMNVDGIKDGIFAKVKNQITV